MGFERSETLIGIGGLILIGAVSACSKPDLGRPLEKFADATANAEKALKSYNERIHEQAKQQRIRGATANPQFVTIRKDGDQTQCQTGSALCTIILASKKQDFLAGKGTPIDPTPPLARVVLLMSKISTYAANLKSIADADNVSKVKTSTAAIAGSITNIAKVVDEKRASSVGDFSEPIAELTAWLIGQYLNRLKIDALRKATEKADGYITEANQKILQSVSKQIHLGFMSQAARKVSEAKDSFDNNASESNLNQLLSAAADFNTLATSNPSKVFDSMIAAHQGLTEALKEKKVTFGEAFARIQAFAAEAEALGKIIEKFAKAVEKANG